MKRRKLKVKSKRLEVKIKKNKIHFYKQWEIDSLTSPAIQLPERIEFEIKQVVAVAFREDGSNSSYEISVILTTDDYITKLNKEYLNINQPTDVLCFPYSTGKHFQAEIYISLHRASEQSRKFNHTLKQEILFLVLHGLLHLFGFKDNTEVDRKKMWTKQEQLLNVV